MRDDLCAGLDGGAYGEVLYVPSSFGFCFSELFDVGDVVVVVGGGGCGGFVLADFVSEFTDILVVCGVEVSFACGGGGMWRGTGDEDDVLFDGLHAVAGYFGGSCAKIFKILHGLGAPSFQRWEIVL